MQFQQVWSTTTHLEYSNDAKSENQLKKEKLRRLQSNNIMMCLAVLHAKNIISIEWRDCNLTSIEHFDVKSGSHWHNIMKVSKKMVFLMSEFDTPHQTQPQSRTKHTISSPKEPPKHQN